ncbi:uncharacterized protein LOC135638647 [Musa acuminata AAA Group]|uniref:uncharacterized protein LOC135638647 n=1 Tax=Musa acuminata AAA Group TaxID=214697 RepID=UPI0031DE2D71
MAQDFTLQEEEDEVFFDSRDYVSSVSDSCPGSLADNGLFPEDQFISWPRVVPQVWIKDPVSVRERRDKFMKIFGVDMMNSSPEESDSSDEELKVDGDIEPDIGRVMSDCGAVLRSPCSGGNCSMSSLSNEEMGASCSANNLGKDGSLRSLHEVGYNRSSTLHELERNFGPSSLTQQLMRKEDDASIISKKSVERTKIGWLRRLGAAACMLDRQGDKCSSNFSNFCRGGSTKTQRVKVHPYKKRSKELSAVYKRHDFKAHNGAILTMKFSPDGQYLATGGEDGVVRVWYVKECERTDEKDILGDDPSCIYFTVNDTTELTPLYVDEEKKLKSRSTRITSDPVCVVIPPEAFQLSEEPLHEFHGHDGDVLDISWSNNKCLLSSSMDKTVHMWQVGSEDCVKIFPHNDYVTCVQFNPINEAYFISGSVDGKVRIWEISGCRVVGWVDTREIVTAACYRPDGKGAVIGTLAGNCRFYDASENHLQLDAQVSLQGKKKSSKRITGFQFCPSNPHKLMVSSADSQIRIFDGIDVVSKFKCIQNSGSQVSASFTADGQHIFSASEDSNVYMWSHHASDVAPTSHHVKSTWSSERFISSNASIVIPWCGLQCRKSGTNTSEVPHLQKDVFRENAGLLGYDFNCHIKDLIGKYTLNLSPSSCFSLSHEFLESLRKSSATWPEEKLPSNFVASTFYKSHYKSLKTFRQTTSHAWGQVIVAAGSDGWIRSYQNYGLPQHL